MVIMTRMTIFLLVFISTLVFCNAFNTLIPSGYELVYSYSARVSAGTYKPTPFASQFFIKGTLRIQNEDSSIFVRLTDLKHGMLNGKLNRYDEFGLTLLDLPEEASDMMKTFSIVYDENKVKYLVTEKQEEHNSRNFKKALASILQLDMNQIKTNSTTPYAFTTSEDSIYGNGLARYVVTPEDPDEIITVNKMIDLKNMHQRYSYVSTTDESQSLHVENLFKNQISMDSHRLYRLVKNNKRYFVKNIYAQGIIYMHLLKGSSESEYVQVNQTFTLEKLISIKEKLAITGEQQKDDLAFNSEISEDRLAYFSFGRYKPKVSHIEEKVYELLNDMVTNIDDVKLELEKPDLEKSQSINRLIHVLELLEVASLENFFTKMKAKTGEHDSKMFTAFQEMVPLVGSHASTIFIRNIIKKHKVTDKVAITMLKKMPFHIRKTDATLLTEIEDLLKLEGVSTQLQKTATLSFASMVYKTYIHEKLQNSVSKNQTNLDYFLEKYILQFITLLESSQDYSSQSLYISALSNIELGNVAKYLEPYVVGVATTNRHLRYLAMCASFAGAIKDPTRLFEVYAPILTDRSLHLELRSAAYMTIMNAKPSMQKLWDVYWFLKNEPCPQLYHLHYTFLKSMVHTTIPELQEMKVFANQVLNYMREPYTHTLTGFYMSDYTDPTFAFSGKAATMLLSTNTSRMIYMDWSSRMFNIPTGRYSIRFKLEGIDLTKLQMTKEFSYLDQLNGMLVALKKQNTIHVEYTILTNNKIVYMDYFNHQNIHNCEIIPPSNISFEVNSQILMPNDLGTSTFMKFSLPQINNNAIKIFSKMSQGVPAQKAEIRLQHSKHMFLGFTVHNPIADSWHDIQRLHSFDFKLPIDIELSTPAQNAIDIIFSLPKNDKESIMGIRNYATKVTTVFDPQHFFEKSNKGIKDYQTVSLENKYKTAKTLFETNCEDTGLKLQFATYDTTPQITRHMFEQFKAFLSEKFFKNYEMMPATQSILTMHQSLSYMVSSPRIGPFGIIFRAMPSTVYQVDHVKLRIQFNLEVFSQKGSKLGNKKFTFKATWLTQTADNNVINVWDIMSDTTTNQNNLDIKYDLELTKVTPGKTNYKICINGTQKFKGTTMVGNILVNMDEVVNYNKCPENGFKLNMSIKGGLSDEQIRMNNNGIQYLECLPQHMYEPSLKEVHATNHYDSQCIEKYTTMRKYEYDFKWKQLNEFVESKYQFLINYFIGQYNPYYSTEEANTGLDANNLKLTIEYPTNGNEMNVTLVKQSNIIRLTEAPSSSYLQWIGIRPYSYHYPYVFTSLRNTFFQKTKTCLVTSDLIYDDFYDVKPMKSKDWTLVVQSNPKMPAEKKMELFVKKVDGELDLAMKLIILDEILEIIPSGNDYKITHNNKPLIVEEGSYVNMDLFSIGKMTDEHHTLIINLHDFVIFLDYDGKKLRIEKNNLFYQYIGLCFNL